MSVFFDTHCHIHEIDGSQGGVHQKWHGDAAWRSGESVLAAARAAGVSRLLVIGTTLADSELAVQFAEAHEGVWASIGIHPHEAKGYTTERPVAGRDAPQTLLRELTPETAKRFARLAAAPKVVAIGECGLDYFYGHSPREDQVAVLRFQIEVALAQGLPLSFHVREAFEDFWPIFESYHGVRGVLHSFTDSPANMERAVDRGLYIGVNGIATFTKDAAQLVTYRIIPQRSLLLETDAPFLTPKPFRGTICEPKHLVHTAEFLAVLRDESVVEIAHTTTRNAQNLFGITV